MPASEKRIYFLLQRAAHELKINADASLRTAGGMTTAQAAVMSIVVSRGLVTQRELADTLSQRESAITAMAARLLKAGYIEKRRSSADARAWELSATDAGIQALSESSKAFDKLNAILDRSLGVEAIDSLADILATIIDELGPGRG
ncbi:MAG: MarR family winged helix-turn-helix transcriptional regulator [Halioglobus sp.]